MLSVLKTLLAVQVCEVEDLLLELSETSVVLSGTGDEMVTED